MSAGRVATMVAVSVLLLASPGAAQTPDGDPNVAAPFGSKPVDDQRIFVHGLLDQFEARIGDAYGFRWDGQAWIGTDANRLRLKSEAAVGSSGTVSDGLHQILYDRPISTYFDAQTGIRLDLDSGPLAGMGCARDPGIGATILRAGRDRLRERLRPLGSPSRSLV